MRRPSRPWPVLLGLALLIAPSACNLFDNDEQTPTEPNPTARVVVLEGVNLQANDAGKAEFLGQVQNVGNATARNVRISVSVFSAAGVLIDVASTTAVPSVLEPQQFGDFKIVTSTDAPNVSSFTFTVEWED